MKDLTCAITTIICFTIVLVSIVIAINTNKTETVNTEIENCEHDFSGAYVDKYHYEVHYIPEMIQPITITTKD